MFKNLTFSLLHAKAAPDIKFKMRYVAKSLCDNKHAIGVMPMLAAHGGVCHVMKEVGIRAAYAALSENSQIDANDPRNQMLKLLYELRELCSEMLYITHQLPGRKASSTAVANTHYIICYRNAIHDKIGLKFIPDPNMQPIEAAKPMVGTFFERFYHVDVMIACILKALNEPPRRLHYNSIVSFLQYNRPERFGNDQDEFLFHCFDENGAFTKGAVAWMLYKIGVLKPAEGAQVDDLALFPPVVVEDMRDELLRSREKAHVEGDMGRDDLTRSQQMVDLQVSADVAMLHDCAEECREQEQ